ncbi:hypothetical protein [Siminovitchia sp. 179-K 8D1 HS]|uniref:hypothetical protein n=1 Tax=Siminovitchia sp. 179-K 8D1 HS TaxID=3142385 RepID=UPI00399EFF28
MLTKNSGGNRSLSGDRPPNVNIKVNGEKYEVKLGSYCWGSDGTTECADTVGPVELLEGEEPIQVQAGEQITLIMDYTPNPNEIHLSQIKNGNEIEVEVNDNQFTVPDEKGTYFYYYGVWWKDEEDKNLSYGDAFYAFALKVK